MNIPRSLRSLASRPILPAVAVVTLALGLGVNAAIFSLTREVLLRPLPYRDAHRLVRVFETSPTLGRTSAPIVPVNYVAWRDRVDAFEQTAMFRRVSFNVSMLTTAVQVEGFQVAPAFFPTLPRRRVLRALVRSLRGRARGTRLDLPAADVVPDPLDYLLLHRISSSTRGQ